MFCDIIKNIKNINKKSSVQGRILEKFVSQGAFTIPEMSKAVGVSLPTTYMRHQRTHEGRACKRGREER